MAMLYVHTSIPLLIATLKIAQFLSQAQFVFIHDAVLESVTCGDTQISAVNLRVEIKKLNEFDSKSSKTGYENQFKVWQHSKPHTV